MSLANTATRFGAVARTLHWLTALLILTAIPLGLLANYAAYDTAEALARKAQLFSLHKTLGVAAFLVALLRILWALTQPRPAPLHPDRRAETALAEAVHWLLYLSLVLVPLSGWIHHSAVTGFAPILWPFGQSLPFVPQSESLAGLAAAVHWLFTKLLALAILLHVAGALKHHLIDRDATLRRMTRGIEAGPQPMRRPRHGAVPALAAAAIYAAGAGLAATLVPAPQTAEVTSPATAPPAPTTAGNWQVVEGSLGFSVQQMGAAVSGQFATWTADITFDEVATDGRHGTVTVTIDMTSLTLGSVTDQAKAVDFFDVPGHPTASFVADILPDGAGYIANGSLTLRGVARDTALPFTLAIDGDTARMTGAATLDRRDFGIGAAYGDEATVGFAAEVSVALTAKRAP